MRFAADTHVHCYPFHNAGRLLLAAHRNLAALTPQSGILAVCLTERADHRAFADLRDGRRSAAGWELEPSADPAALWARQTDGRTLLLIAGRQIIAREGIEVLALGADLNLADGAPARDLLRHIREERALPVLPWGLGKWWGARGRLVRRLIAEAQPGEVALADTFLLPAQARRPALLRHAEQRGFRVLAGTDPLGRPGEEELAGRYGITADGAFDTSEPATSLIRLLGDPAVPLRLIGSRGGWGDTLRRMR